MIYYMVRGISKRTASIQVTETTQSLLMKTTYFLWLMTKSAQVQYKPIVLCLPQLFLLFLSGIPIGFQFFQQDICLFDVPFLQNLLNSWYCCHLFKIYFIQCTGKKFKQLSFTEFSIQGLFKGEYQQRVHHYLLQLKPK